MAEDSFQERTEPATPKKKDESRRKGKVLKSMELNSALILVFGMLILYFTGASLVVNFSAIAREMLIQSGNVQITASTAHQIIAHAIGKFILIVAPFAVGMTLVGLAANIAQVGFLFTFEPLQPSWAKINPMNGMKKVLLSRRSVVELLKNLLKIGIVSLVAYFALNGMMDNTIDLMESDVSTILSFMATAAFGIAFKMGIAFLALAVFDYIYQRFEHEKELRMTKQEVKEEWKSQEGDPQIKGKIRSIQRQIAYRRMMHDVPTADVVVTNPTHIAVAIKYETAKMSAPTVVAKGAELIAQRIKEIAAEHAVPIIEDKPLARALYKSVDIGDEIPAKLFQAVAQLLAYIYRLRNMKPGLNTN
jgi:flagellar biosynthesis protein FlhB